MKGFRCSTHRKTPKNSRVFRAKTIENQPSKATKHFENIEKLLFLNHVFARLTYLKWPDFGAPNGAANEALIRIRRWALGKWEVFI